MESEYLNVLLADDDIDDCLFFGDILKSLKVATFFTAVHDGNQLMQMLTKEHSILPHVLFLDLNMPRKNGFECLSEIRLSKALAMLPVIMCSTSNEQEVVNQLYKNGAHYFIRKPSNILQFKKIIQQALTLIQQKDAAQPTRLNFVITV